MHISICRAVCVMSHSEYVYVFEYVFVFVFLFEYVFTVYTYTYLNVRGEMRCNREDPDAVYNIIQVWVLRASLLGD